MIPPPIPRRNGREFLLGFLPSLIIALINIALLLICDDLAMLNVMFISGAFLVGVAIITLICRRPFIGVGIIAVLVASPLLMMGSCFAIDAFN